MLTAITMNSRYKFEAICCKIKLSKRRGGVRIELEENHFESVYRCGITVEEKKHTHRV